MGRWLSIGLAAGIGVVMLACGGDSSSGPPKGSGGTSGTGGTGGVTLTCSTLQLPPASCGMPCTSDTQCEGAYCDSGSCAASCTATEGCSANEVCNVRGRCEPVFGTGGTGGTGNTGGDNCQSVVVTPTRSIPNVMFLVDQSGSMTSGFGGGENRWEAAHSALNSIVSDLDSIVRFGLTTYTSDDGDNNPPCPRLPTQVDFALDNAGSFVDDPNVYPYSYPGSQSDPTWGGDETPTGDSLDALVNIIQSSPEWPYTDGPTIVVLATDGEPDSCEQPNPNPTAQARQEAVNAAAAAHAAGIDVYVLWVGALNDSGTRAHMQDVANAGVDGTGTVWVGDDPTSLSTAFQTIIGDSISCDITMVEQFVDTDKACQEGDVRLNGVPLACSDTDGWRVKPGNNRVIELVGSACDTLKTGDVTFSAEFPCGSVIVVD